jgi:hypothetical protein
MKCGPILPISDAIQASFYRLLTNGCPPHLGVLQLLRPLLEDAVNTGRGQSWQEAFPGDSCQAIVDRNGASGDTPLGPRGRREKAALRVLPKVGLGGDGSPWEGVPRLHHPFWTGYPELSPCLREPKALQR